MVRNAGRGKRCRPFGPNPRRVAPGTWGFLGNPFDGADALDRFRAYFTRRLDKDPSFRRAALAVRGLRLGCYCKDLDSCHGLIIAEELERAFERGPASIPRCKAVPSDALIRPCVERGRR